MSEIMSPIPFGELIRWILLEYSNEGSVFGVERPYLAKKGKKLPLFDGFIETPLGPAAGPHTQLAENFAAAYYAGARFFELKTVQIMDGEELRKCVPRPCILAEDEGYNCEWSTELTVEEALSEYIKAYFLLKLMSREFGLGEPDGFVFNMSVGYDYAGITSPKIDNFIEGLKDASETAAFIECKQFLIENIHLFERVSTNYIEGISANICNSITLSTLHGCPPEEIERIASYLIENKGLHTFVKCNPTILGYETALHTLNSMGYDYLSFDSHHFREDLQYKDAVPMVKRLRKLAAAKGVEFGLKLSNTFPVDVKQGELPSEEMYMSGRALYPLTIEMARRFTAEFDGRLRLSFSGGADAFNIEALFEAGIWPVTVATTLLKPGGYQRLLQLAQLLSNHEYRAFAGVSVSRTANLSKLAISDPHHKKQLKLQPKRKVNESLPLFNCFIAPCKFGCPIGQDVPEYVSLVGQGKYLQALEVITQTNPLPFITGRVCPQFCRGKCMRGYYEDSIHIRSAKLEAARGGYEALLGELKTPSMTSSKRAAIVGGGPAGLAAAYFLGRSGMPVTLFEKQSELGGIVRYVVPEFRVSGHAVDRDVHLVWKMGVRFKLNTEAPSVETLKAQGYDYVLMATGAWAPGRLLLESGSAINVLEFLMALRQGEANDLGEDICIIGGGNTAMDAARAAKRFNPAAKVKVVYRRSRRYMPADEEELELALEDGVEFLELLNPISFDEGVLTCKKMKLGCIDASGRRSPVETDELVKLECSYLVAAVGEGVEPEPYIKSAIELNSKGRVKTDPKTLETNLKGVYCLGDARRGPATVVEAIADAQLAASHILGQEHEYAISEDAYSSAELCREKVGPLSEYDNACFEKERCLYCNTSCELCAQVCPNRANLALTVKGMESRQILHIERMCNECGNCATFCPYPDAPYLVKPTLFHSEEAFNLSENPGFLMLGDTTCRIRYNCEVEDIEIYDEALDIPNEFLALIRTVVEEYSYLLG